jgi:hypothetical protein
MIIKITEDSNKYLEQMFQDNLKTYNYLKTDILLYLIYGEDVKWTYVQEEDLFYIKQFNNYLTELNRKEWKEMFTENSISINKNRTEISIRTKKEVKIKFLSLLDELEIKYTKKESSKLNKILNGEKE